VEREDELGTSWKKDSTIDQPARTGFKRASLRSMKPAAVWQIEAPSSRGAQVAIWLTHSPRFNNVCSTARMLTRISRGACRSTLPTCTICHAADGRSSDRRLARRISTSSIIMRSSA